MKTKGIVWILTWIGCLIVVFCASFILSIKLYIEPMYDYMSSEKIESKISDLNKQIQQKDQMIVDLQDELEIYRALND